MGRHKSPMFKGGRHFSISVVHNAALDRLITDLKKVYPEKKPNASSTLEWMIEKICGRTDIELRDYMQIRKEMMKITTNKGDSK